MRRSPERGTLYVVATPLGNLQDLSPRALKVLSQVDRIACEDTRHTGRLLSHCAIQKPLISYHEHNEEERVPQLLRALLAGEQIALVCDAGTPLISDPGFRLVRAAREKGCRVIPIPGPSAVTAALSVSGLPTDRFLFLGFLPRPSQLERFLQPFSQLPVSLVAFLSPHRLAETLRQVEAILGDRNAFLIRELSKLHETSYYAPLSQIRSRLGEERPRGEYTLVLAPGEKGEERPSIDVGAYLAGLISHRGLTQKEALQKAARELGIPRRRLYALLHKGESS